MSAPPGFRTEASFGLVQPQEAVQQVRSPNSPKQKEPDHDRPHDRNGDEPGLHQDAEVVPDPMDRARRTRRSPPK